VHSTHDPFGRPRRNAISAGFTVQLDPDGGQATIWGFKGKTKNEGLQTKVIEAFRRFLERSWKKRLSVFVKPRQAIS
jgi:hypothetical protein